MAASFTFDTSGGVIIPGKGLDTLIRWTNLDAFTQSYIGAALSGWIKAGEWAGEGVKTFGHGFSDLAPETLAAMVGDCERYRGKMASKGAALGALFWKNRAAGYEADDGFPPVTLYLGEDGLIRSRTGEAS